MAQEGTGFFMLSNNTEVLGPPHHHHHHVHEGLGVFPVP
jgi:hypothetical protein